MGKGGGSRPVESTTKTEPWSEQQPHLKKVFSEAERLYQSPGPSLMPGSQVAPMTDAERYAQTYLKNLAGTQVGAAADLGAAQKFGLGAVLSPNSNAYLRDYADAATRGIWDNLNNNVLGQTRAAASGANQFGSSRHGVVEGIASKAAIDADAATRAGIYSNAYGQGLDVFKSTLAGAPSTMMAQQIPGQVLSGVGAQERAFSQALLDEEVAKWNFEQNLPFTKLAQYQNLVQGNYGGTSTANQMLMSQGSGSQLGSLIGLGLMAASMFMS